VETSCVNHDPFLKRKWEGPCVWLEDYSCPYYHPQYLTLDNLFQDLDLFFNLLLGAKHTYINNTLISLLIIQNEIL
jgi:hypothetical protein